MTTFPAFEVIPSKVWIHQQTGQKVSPFGACPWMHDSQRQHWKLINQGWTIRDNITNTVGCGRPPWNTEAEAQAIADKWNTERQARHAQHRSKTP